MTDTVYDGLSPYNHRLADGSLAPPGPSVFDPLPEYVPPPWTPPSDGEIAATQRRIGDAYAAWSQRQAAKPQPQAGLAEYGSRGSYPEFADILDADDAGQTELHGEVQRAIAGAD